MGKIRRGGFIFVTWIGDHPPRHVHVFRNGRQVLKFDVDRWKVIEGRISRKLAKILFELRNEERL